MQTIRKGSDVASFLTTMKTKNLLEYTQAEKVKFLNTYREKLTQTLGRKASDFDMLACKGGADFYEACNVINTDLNKAIVDAVFTPLNRNK